MINKRLAIVFFFTIRQTLHEKTVIIEKRRYKLMEEVKKLELKIKNNSRYEDIIEQSMQIDKYIDKIIEGAL
jgi:hypothetical protein